MISEKAYTSCVSNGALHRSQRGGHRSPGPAPRLAALVGAIRLWQILLACGIYYAILMTEERYLPHIQLDLNSWWAAQDRVNRIIYFMLLGAFLLASVSAAAILLLPKPGDQFTKFYMLGPESLAEHFPRQSAPGQPITVTLGLTNREHHEHTYRVEVWAVDYLLHCLDQGLFDG